MEGRSPARTALGPLAPEPYRGVVGLRRFLVPATLLVLAGAIGLGAIADHRWKQRRIGRAEVAEWYCTHRGTHCGGPSSAAIERHWNRRQLGYEIAVVVLGGSALALAAARAARG
jgi:hypothetical protein